MQGPSYTEVFKNYFTPNYENTPSKEEANVSFNKNGRKRLPAPSIFGRKQDIQWKNVVKNGAILGDMSKAFSAPVERQTFLYEFNQLNSSEMVKLIKQLQQNLSESPLEIKRFEIKNTMTLAPQELANACTHLDTHYQTKVAQLISESSPEVGAIYLSLALHFLENEKYFALFVDQQKTLVNTLKGSLNENVAVLFYAEKSHSVAKKQAKEGSESAINAAMSQKLSAQGISWCEFIINHPTTTPENKLRHYTHWIKHSCEDLDQPQTTSKLREKINEALLLALKHKNEVNSVEFYYAISSLTAQTDEEMTQGIEIFANLVEKQSDNVKNMIAKSSFFEIMASPALKFKPWEFNWTQETRLQFIKKTLTLLKHLTPNELGQFIWLDRLILELIDNLDYVPSLSTQEVDSLQTYLNRMDQKPLSLKCALLHQEDDANLEKDYLALLIKLWVSLEKGEIDVEFFNLFQIRLTSVEKKLSAQQIKKLEPQINSLLEKINNKFLVAIVEGINYNHCYEVAQNYEQLEKYNDAFPLFLRAAELKHLSSMYKVSKYLYLGLGTKEDLQKAWEWASKLNNLANKKSQHQQEYEKLLEEINAKLTATNTRKPPKQLDHFLEDDPETLPAIKTSELCSKVSVSNQKKKTQLQVKNLLKKETKLPDAKKKHKPSLAPMQPKQPPLPKAELAFAKRSWRDVVAGEQQKTQPLSEIVKPKENHQVNNQDTQDGIISCIANFIDLLKRYQSTNEAHLLASINLFTDLTPKYCKKNLPKVSAIYLDIIKLCIRMGQFTTIQPLYLLATQKEILNVEIYELFIQTMYGQGLLNEASFFYHAAKKANFLNKNTELTLIALESLPTKAQEESDTLGDSIVPHIEALLDRKPSKENLLIILKLLDKISPAYCQHYPDKIRQLYSNTMQQCIEFYQFITLERLFSKLHQLILVNDEVYEKAVECALVHKLTTQALCYFETAKKNGFMSYKLHHLYIRALFWDGQSRALAYSEFEKMHLPKIINGQVEMQGFNTTTVCMFMDKQREEIIALGKPLRIVFTPHSSAQRVETIMETNAIRSNLVAYVNSYNASHAQSQILVPEIEVTETGNLLYSQRKQMHTQIKNLYWGPLQVRAFEQFKLLDLPKIDMKNCRINLSGFNMTTIMMFIQVNASQIATLTTPLEIKYTPENTGEVVDLSDEDIIISFVDQYNSCNQHAPIQLPVIILEEEQVEQKPPVENIINRNDFFASSPAKNQNNSESPKRGRQLRANKLGIKRV